jgi:hypothetical protein
MAKAFDGALIGFLVGGYFVTVLYYPFFWINLAMTVALHNSTLRELQRQKVTQPRGTRGQLRGGLAAPMRGRGYG